jgi:hypothetical protein
VEFSVNAIPAATGYVTGTGQRMTTHPLKHCKFRWCVIHNPMPGVWEPWPTHWRTDRNLMERICPCGVGHPAAEEYMIHNYAVLVHGCCGIHQCIPDLDNLSTNPGIIDGEVVIDVELKEIGS